MELQISIYGLKLQNVYKRPIKTFALSIRLGIFAP